MRPRRAKGTSVVEVAVACAALATLMVGVLGALTSGMRTATRTVAASDLAARGRLSLDRIRAELAYARVVSVGAAVAGVPAADHTSIRYQVPVGTPGLALPVPVLGGAPRWGYRDASGALQEGWYGEIGFAATAILYETDATPLLLAPPHLFGGLPFDIVDADLNGDGDRTDAFVLGRLVQRSLDPALAVAEASPFDEQVALAPRPGLSTALDGDVDGDALADAIFAVLDRTGNEVDNASIAAAGRRVRVTLWHAQIDERRHRLVRRRNREEVRLENPQS